MFSKLDDERQGSAKLYGIVLRFLNSQVELVRIYHKLYTSIQINRYRKAISLKESTFEIFCQSPLSPLTYVFFNNKETEDEEIILYNYANYLHFSFCTKNHQVINGCEWITEMINGSPWCQEEHLKWLEVAIKLSSKNINAETIEKKKDSLYSTILDNLTF